VDDSRGDPPDDDCIDVCLRPYERNSGVEEAMKAYLSWRPASSNRSSRTIPWNSTPVDPEFGPAR
jgi:hypothetical protein